MSLFAEEKSNTVSFVHDNKWIAMWSQFRDCKELTRELLLAVVDRVIISGNNKINVVFKHRDDKALMLLLSENEVDISA